MNTRLLRYYRSSLWRHHPGRQAAFERAGYRCEGCNTTERLEAHHRYYPRELGTETADALTILCRLCHQAITSRIRRQRYRRRVLPVLDTIRQRPILSRSAWQMVSRQIALVPEDIRRQRPPMMNLAQKEPSHVPRLPLSDTRRRTPPHA
jgi:hypothetical protein